MSVAVQTPERTFIRQLLAGYPQYTEDVIATDDPQQPMQRAVKALGRPLVDETLEMSLGYAVALTGGTTLFLALILARQAHGAMRGSLGASRRERKTGIGAGGKGCHTRSWIER